MNLPNLEKPENIFEKNLISNQKKQQFSTLQIFFTNFYKQYFMEFFDSNQSQSNLLVIFMGRISQREVEITSRIEHINRTLYKMNNTMGKTENTEKMNKLEKYANKLLQERKYLEVQISQINSKHAHDYHTHKSAW